MTRQNAEHGTHTVESDAPLGDWFRRTPESLRMLAEETEALRSAEIAARETLARRIVRDRLHFYGITDEEIDAERLMDPVDHAAHGCLPVQPGQWECFNEFDSPTHPRHDWADEAAEFVCWMLDHPLVAPRAGRVLNPGSVGNPDETPVVQVSPALARHFERTRCPKCGYINHCHADDCTTVNPPAPTHADEGGA